jgi:uncharacterized protein YjbI with pentapeptide repeats
VQIKGDKLPLERNFTKRWTASLSDLPAVIIAQSLLAISEVAISIRRKRLSPELTTRPLRILGDLELIAAADDHLRWVETGGLTQWLETLNIEALPQAITSVCSESIAGAQADFRGTDLRSRDLRQHKLPGALFTGADLTGAHLQGADLAYAQLQRAKVSEAQLAGATFYHADLSDADLHKVSGVEIGMPGPDLTDAILRSVDLRGADLASARGLAYGSLAGCVLTDSKLPEPVAKFDAPLAQAAETSKNASLIFLTMLAACAFSWLTIASTTIASLIKNTATSPLPLVGAEIPIASFYWAAPLVLFGVYLYLHLYLVRLWQALGTLPAVFPDGAVLDDKVYPWLLNGLARLHFDRLRYHQNLMARVETWVSVFLAWYLVPLTVTGFWARYLVRHDWPGTAFQVTILTLSIVTGLLFYRIACEALPTKDSDADEAWARRLTLSVLIGVVAGFLVLGIFYKPSAFLEQPVLTTAAIFLGVVIASLAVFTLGWVVGRIFGDLAVWRIAALAGGLLLIVSAGAIGGQRSRFSTLSFDLTILGLSEGSGPKSWIPNAFEALGLPTHAVLITDDLSTRPPNWTGLASGEQKEISQVKGALLEGSDLRFADAIRVFLVNARMSHADLRSAYFFESDLRGAILLGADLRNAHLDRTRMEGADLASADLRDAVLFRVNLANVRLRGARLDGLQIVIGLPSPHGEQNTVQFSNTDVSNVDFSRVKGLKPEMLKGFCIGNPISWPTFPPSAEFKDMNLNLPLCSPRPLLEWW